MARPKSEDKQKAILEAALRVFAERGIANAPTSAISREAGISEGSLFTYFRTKEELMSALYTDLRTEFSRQLTDFPHGTSAQIRLRYIWDRYLDLGAAHPEQLKVLMQLRASGRLFKEDETPAFAFVEVLKATNEAVQGMELSDAPPEYLVLMMRSMAEITIEYIQAHPEHAKVCRELGHRMVWAGLTSK